MSETDLPLATGVSEELSEMDLLDHIRSVVGSGCNRIVLLNVRMEDVEGEGSKLTAVVFSAKASC